MNKILNNNDPVADYKGEIVQYPVQARYCICGEGRKYYMAPITEALAIEIGKAEEPFHKFEIGDWTIQKSSVYALLKDARNTKSIPPKIMIDIKRLFDEKNMNAMPAKYDFNTLKGSLCMTVCRDFMTHYKYGLSFIGNPEHVIIFKY